MRCVPHAAQLSATAIPIPSRAQGSTRADLRTADACVGMNGRVVYKQLTDDVTLPGWEPDLTRLDSAPR